MKYHSNIGRILLVVLALGVLSGTMMAQQVPQNSPQTDPQVGQSPRQTPSQDRVADADLADTSAFAWGTLVTGFLIGAAAGYLLGTSSRPPASRVDNDIRSDHDRVA